MRALHAASGFRNFVPVRRQEYKPEITLSFVEAFVKGKEFPRYVAPPPSAAVSASHRAFGRRP